MLDEPDLIARPGITLNPDVGKPKPKPPVVKPKPRPKPKAAEYGIIGVASKPIGCQIYIGGKNMGKTPKRGIKVKAGKKKVTLVCNEHGIRDSFFITVKPGPNRATGAAQSERRGDSYYCPRLHRGPRPPHQPYSDQRPQHRDLALVDPELPGPGLPVRRRVVDLHAHHRVAVGP